MKKRLDTFKSSWDLVEEDRRAVKIDILYEQVTEMLLDAEKCCRKLRTGEAHYYPEVSRASEI